MKPEYKKYILENINSKPIHKIAQELGLKEKKIRKFLEQEREEKQTTPKQEKRTPDKKGTVFISIALIIVLGLAAYANSLDGEFIWDDGHLVKNNPYVKSFSNIGRIFLKDIGAGVGRSYAFYRPIQIASYAADYFLWSLDVRGYHLTNILLHILVSIAVYRLVYILFGNNTISLLSGIFFVVHPIHTEAVTYISGRADSLAALFILLCFIFYIRYLQMQKAGLYILVLLTCILALLSRENSIVLPILLLLYHYTFRKRVKVKSFFPIIGIVLFYGFLRITALKFMLQHTFYHTTTLFDRLPGFFVAIAKYVRLLILPSHLHMEYGEKIFNYNNPNALLGIIITLLLILYAVRNRRRNNIIFFSISWFFITLLPVSNLYPINAYMAEHWLYMPAIGFFIVLASYADLLFKNRKLRFTAVLLTIAIVFYYAGLTFKQNNYWKEPIAFYKRTLQYAPDSSKSYYNLGTIYGSTGKEEQAVDALKKAIAITPNDAEAHYQLGVTHYNAGRLEDAIASYKKAITIAPHDISVYNNLGVAYRRLGNYEEAIKLLKKLIELDPDNAGAHNNLGNVYFTTGDIEKAIGLYKKTVEMDPSFAIAYFNLSKCYFHRKEFVTAVEYCELAKKHGYDVPPEFLETLESHPE
jgi:tetratricopeptide (TPR) repeat protein